MRRVSSDVHDYILTKRNRYIAVAPSLRGCEVQGIRVSHGDLNLQKKHDSLREAPPAGTKPPWGEGGVGRALLGEEGRGEKGLRTFAWKPRP